MSTTHDTEPVETLQLRLVRLTRQRAELSVQLADTRALLDRLVRRDDALDVHIRLTLRDLIDTYADGRDLPPQDDTGDPAVRAAITALHEHDTWPAREEEAA